MTRPPRLRACLAQANKSIDAATSAGLFTYSQIATIMYITVENAKGEDAVDTHLTAASQIVYAAIGLLVGSLSCL